MVHGNYRQDDLFITRISPKSRAVAKTPSRITTSELLKMKQNHIEASRTFPHTLHASSSRTIRTHFSELVKKIKPAFLTPKKKGNLVVEGFSPSSPSSSSRGGYNSQKYKYTNILTKKPKKPKKPKKLKKPKTPKMPNILTKKPKKSIKL